MTATPERIAHLRAQARTRYLQTTVSRHVVQRITTTREYFPIDLRLECGHVTYSVGGIRHRVVLCRRCTEVERADRALRDAARCPVHELRDLYDDRTPEGIAAGVEKHYTCGACEDAAAVRP